MNSRIIKWPALGYFAIMLAALCLGSTNGQKQPPSPRLERPEAKIRMVIFDGDRWLRVQQGQYASWYVRISAVTAFKFSEPDYPGESSINYAGGKIGVQISEDDLRNIHREVRWVLAPGEMKPNDADEKPGASKEK